MLEANTLIRSDTMHERGRSPFPLTAVRRSFGSRRSGVRKALLKTEAAGLFFSELQPAFDSEINPVFA